jgi:hypothetical protein
MDQRLIETLSRKPKSITRFPEWMLPKATIDILKDTKDTAIAEIAGRDSLAAVIKASEERAVKAILPTIAYTGTEFGDWNIPYEKCLFLKKRMEGSGIRIFDPVFLGDPEFWHLLCGRYLSLLFKDLGFYTPCLGCHLYLHVIRIPLARMTGTRLLIAGEREHHERRIKLNQIPESLDAYQGFLGGYDIELYMPLRHLVKGEDVERLLEREWKEGAEQMQCVLSRNYLDANGSVNYERGTIQRFFDYFAFGEAARVLNAYLTFDGTGTP